MRQLISEMGREWRSKRCLVSTRHGTNAAIWPKWKLFKYWVIRTLLLSRRCYTKIKSFIWSMSSLIRIFTSSLSKWGTDGWDLRRDRSRFSCTKCSKAWDSFIGKGTFTGIWNRKIWSWETKRSSRLQTLASSKSKSPRVSPAPSTLPRDGTEHQKWSSGATTMTQRLTCLRSVASWLSSIP
jgi:hypothetical protein